MNSFKNQIKTRNRTSLLVSLNSLNSSGFIILNKNHILLKINYAYKFFIQDWMLPETRQLLAKQERKEKKMKTGIFASTSM